MISMRKILSIISIYGIIIVLLLTLNLNTEATDDGNNSNSKLDNSPFINIISPTNGSSVHEIFTVEGIASNGTGIWSVHVRINERDWQEAQGYSTWNSILVLNDISEGWVTLEAVRYHEVEETVVDSIKIFINRSYSNGNFKPFINLVSPQENVFVIHKLYVEGISQDDNEVVTTYISSGGYGWIVLSTDESWNRSMNILWMMEGRHQIAFVAFDGERASNVVYINFTKEPYVPPRIIIENPTVNQKFFDGIDISGSVTDGIQPISEVEIRVNGGEWISVNGTREWYYYLNDEGLPFGEILIEVRALDSIHEYSEIVEISTHHSSDEYIVNNNNPMLLFILLGIISVFIIAMLVKLKK